jgi:hypothetical protein
LSTTAIGHLKNKKLIIERMDIQTEMNCIHCSSTFFILFECFYSALSSYTSLVLICHFQFHSVGLYSPVIFSSFIFHICPEDGGDEGSAVPPGEGGGGGQHAHGEHGPARSRDAQVSAHHRPHPAC